MKCCARILSFCALLACCSLTISLGATAVSAADTQGVKLVDDDYTQASYPHRNAARGDWIIADGVASVTQDDELYKKYKNHGPIMIYTVPHTDASAVVEFKPEGCRAVVFTMDAAEGGHAFRVKLVPEDPKRPRQRSAIVSYLAKKPGAEKAEQVVLNNKNVPALADGDWTRLEVTVVGDTATVKLGEETIRVQHDQIAQAKKIAKLGFSFGALEIRQFQLQAE